MNGMGLIRGLAVTFGHFVETYLDEIRHLRAGTKSTVAEKSSAASRGLFTIEFPEEEMPVPEEFRFLPFLIYEEGEDGSKIMRCTSCGICPKVCPPQCIWIVRTTDPVTGRPVPSPAEFYIDTDICMNCGYCAEYCPFDAIKMDHDFKISSYDRTTDNIFDLEKLSKPLSYYAAIRPTNYAREEAVRKADREAKAARKAGTAASN